MQMTSGDRISKLLKAGDEVGQFGMPQRVERQLLDFAAWRLPRHEAVALVGEAQLDEWRWRIVNLVRWIRLRREMGEGPSLGDPFQVATELASYPLDAEIPEYLDAKMTYFRSGFLERKNIISLSYVVQALVAATLVGGPAGMPLRRWIADNAPHAWDSPPTERDGYHLLVWLGPREAPHVVVEAILAMESEVLNDPWNVDDVPSWAGRGMRHAGH
jgi:hypothetical protein